MRKLSLDTVRWICLRTVESPVNVSGLLLRVHSVFHYLFIFGNSSRSSHPRTAHVFFAGNGVCLGFLLFFFHLHCASFGFWKGLGFGWFDGRYRYIPCCLLLLCVSGSSLQNALRLSLIEPQIFDCAAPPSGLLTQRSTGIRSPYSYFCRVVANCCLRMLAQRTETFSSR